MVSLIQLNLTLELVLKQIYTELPSTVFMMITYAGPGPAVGNDVNSVNKNYF